MSKCRVFPESDVNDKIEEWNDFLIDQSNLLQLLPGVADAGIFFSKSVNFYINKELNILIRLTIGKLTIDFGWYSFHMKTTGATIRRFVSKIISQEIPRKCANIIREKEQLIISLERSIEKTKKIIRTLQDYEP